MTGEPMDEWVRPLHPAIMSLVEELVGGSGGSIEVVREGEQWVALEETTSTMAFAEAEGDELRVVPFVGDVEAARTRPYVRSLGVSWLNDERELVVEASVLSESAARDEVLGYLKAALDFWRQRTDPELPRGTAPAPSEPTPSKPTSREPAASQPALFEPDELAELERKLTEPVAEAAPGGTDEPTVMAQMRADISDQWSWASSAARIPQISNLLLDLPESVAQARVSVRVTDVDLLFGSKVVHEGPLPAGPSAVGTVHVPLSARVMSQVQDRYSAECEVVLEDAAAGTVLARHSEAIDIQPRDLWLWSGDPRRGEQRERLQRRERELVAALEEEPEGSHAPVFAAELSALRRATAEDNGRMVMLSRSLLASFVRPTHPEVAAVAREAASRLEMVTGDGSFFAFQLGDVAEVERRADATVDAIYEALRSRSIAYSEPPPGWDYRGKGQRIRDHGDVAGAGLGTCMDTTVLMAAVIEHVGLLPVLVLIPGHIFVGYWRRDPLPERSAKPEWYPGVPLVTDPAAVRTLVQGGWLGVIETTAFTTGNDEPPAAAHGSAMRNLARGVAEDFLQIIDVAAARRSGVSPLPVVNERPDGVTEIIEYRPGGAAAVTAVPHDAADAVVSERQVDSHPARYRTWKSSLFSLNATNALLNLGSNARVQPLVLPPELLGTLEDRLNQDVSFTLHSSFDLPEVYQARGVVSATQMEDEELASHFRDRTLYVQRFGRVKGQQGPLSPATFVRELRSMAHNAKTARDERGMNPLFLCLGVLRWPYKPGVMAEAPMILVPVTVSVSRGRQQLTLALDPTQQTTVNAALIEWLRREHGMTIPSLAEPPVDRAGIDVDGVLAECRKAVAERGKRFEVAAEARLATLDLSAFRMWQDLNLHADDFLQRPLVRHLVETPTEPFEDPAVGADDAAAIAAVLSDELEKLEKLETPIPADATQKQAVLWARQGRTFVLQGPPGTGKSQTITNMVAESVLAGLSVLFVAEKGTALSVVQRRLDDIGLSPFTLNLHHEGSNAAEVRAQLKRALGASVQPDRTAMESAGRRLRNARFELQQYPQRLHETNAAGRSAYTARDELLVLGEGPVMPVPHHLVAHQAQTIDALLELFEGLQQWTAAAGVREDHAWRLAGPGDGNPFDVATVARAVSGVLDGTTWAAATVGPLREALGQITCPEQLRTLADAASPVLPQGAELAAILAEPWPAAAAEAVAGCEHSVENWAGMLHGFAPEVLQMDLRGIATELETATASSLFGRSKRQTAAIAPLVAVAPPSIELHKNNAAAVLKDLIAVQDASASVRSVLGSVAGLRDAVPANPFTPGALRGAHARLEELTTATAPLRGADAWTLRVRALSEAGHLAGYADQLVAFDDAWRQLWTSLVVNGEDFEAWRSDRSLLDAIAAVSATWRRQAEFERLLPLQHWCTLVRKLAPLREAGLGDARVDLLEGRLPAYEAEDALARGVAQASLEERVTAAGLDRFNAVAHDQQVTVFTEAQAQVRKHWVTEGPSALLERRGGGGLGRRTGGLARELEKTTRKLGTRAILRKHGAAVHELTPLVLCSPSSVVDLIEPGVMEFDLVIFDEASQITVPEAVGALGRARAAIIVGDSKQMPPTRRVGAGAAQDEEIDDPEAEEIVEDQESILSECELARVPTLSLSWHYRSQDEALIAFSNRTYYRGELSSFPTPTLLSSETGVEFRRVYGRYLRAGAAKVEVAEGIVAGNNTNPDEAVAIVQTVRELVDSSIEPPSIGIVTFNEQQRQLIEDLLYAVADARLADVLEEAKMGRGNALFVKALEQVQGDERDTIIFSIAFSKQANGKIPTNFGPLSNSGGERRLNVAVTRARRKNIVFCSFDPAELDVSGSTYAGPKDLKEFLTFVAKASSAAQEPEETVNRLPVRDRHRDDIAAALRAAGLHVMADVGLSNFRLDLVLARPESPDRPLLPVLLDGESWRSRHTVSDRDVLPVEVLENLMGWPSVARVWWPMWLQNRQEVIDSISALVDEAEAMLEERTPEQQPSLDPAQPVHVEPVPAADTPELEAASGLLLRRQPPGADGAGDGEASVPRGAPPAAAQRDEGRADADAASAHAFVPAHTDAVGSRTILDALPDRKAAAAVREQLLDVIATEGPVEVGRLTRIVARRFGLSSVRAARAEGILKLVPRLHLRKSRLGTFAWPTELDPSTWTSFRPADADGSRSMSEIAPEELANAMRWVMAQQPATTDDEMLRRTAEIFGVSRLGANVRSRLVAVLATLPDGGGASSTELRPAGGHVAPEGGSAHDDGAEVALRVEDIAALLADAITSSGTGGFDVGPGFVQWQGDSVAGLYVEVGDGQDYKEPFDAALADDLVSGGWEGPAPRKDIRNCWFSVPMAANGDESERSFAARMRSSAELVAYAMTALDRRGQ